MQATAARDAKRVNIYVLAEDDRFAREQARLFFGGNLSEYVRSLVKLDREERLTRQRMITAALRDREAVPA